MNKVFVGTFKEDNLTKGKDKLEINEAKEKHGLKYVNTEYVKKGGQIVGMKIWVCDLDTFDLKV